MTNKNHKFVCIFDSSHYVDSQQKLIKHMTKCKAMEKQSYQCCKYNPLHWVKYNTIKQHQANCQNKPKNNDHQFTRILPNQISNFDLQIPFQIDMSMLSTSSLVQTNKQKKQSKIQLKKQQQFAMKKKQKRQVQKIKKIKMWQQPDFEEFLIKQKQYKANKNKIQKKNQARNLMNNNDSFLF